MGIFLRIFKLYLFVEQFLSINLCFGYLHGKYIDKAVLLKVNHVVFSWNQYTNFYQNIKADNILFGSLKYPLML